MIYENHLALQYIVFSRTFFDAIGDIIIDSFKKGLVLRYCPGRLFFLFLRRSYTGLAPDYHNQPRK